MNCEKYRGLYGKEKNKRRVYAIRKYHNMSEEGQKK